MNIEEQTTPPKLVAPRPIRRWRWWVHLLLLALYPIALGLVPMIASEPRGGTLLPNNKIDLILGIGAEVGIFAAIFAVAWMASRANRDQLFLRWNGGFRPVILAIAYSIGLRLVIAVAVAAFAAVMTLAGGLGPDTLENIRPRTETVIDTEVLVSDPVYLALNLTVVSFVMAGLREELWRAGLIAGFIALAPTRLQGTRGYFLAAGLAAVIFGVGHLPQGLGGVALTTLLGMGLGAIMILHRSVWAAVLAHGFFDATTFISLAFLARYYPELIPGG